MAHIPQFDSIDYGRPEIFVGIDPSFAGSGRVDTVAATLSGSDPERTLGNVWRWIRDNLAAETKQRDYRWRTASEIIDRGRYFGCAEHALVYGTCARACGIPAVWVKSLDVPWIRKFVGSGQFDGGSGHVYLEVFLKGRWRLLDATQDELFDEYDPSQRLLPGRTVERYAYDKGGNARELVLSLDWEPWKEETKAFFRRFDLDGLQKAKPATSGAGRRLAV